MVRREEGGKRVRKVRGRGRSKCWGSKGAGEKDRAGGAIEPLGRGGVAWRFGGKRPLGRTATVKIVAVAAKFVGISGRRGKQNITKFRENSGLEGRLLTGWDCAGRPFLSQKDRIRAALLDAAPFPTPLNSAVEKDPRQTFGVRWSRQSGSLERQVLQGLGMKVQNELSPESKMFAIGRDYRSDKNQAPAAGVYGELRQALSNNNLDAAKDEVRWLVQTQGKKLDAIREAVGGPESAKYAGPLKADNQNMVKNLTPAQREVYRQAQADHTANARKFASIAASLRGELSALR